MPSLKGQTALVTGASSGIGAEIARAFASAGANVAVNYPVQSEESGAEKVLEEIRSSQGNAISVRADVSKEGQVLEMFEQIRGKYGTLDILVANAGIQRDADFIKMSLDDWHQVIEVNLTGAFLCAREAAKEFLRRGVIQGRSVAAGKIIFTSSVHQIIPWSGHANYAASKGGINLLMKTIAQELAPHKVRANCIAPGAIKTNNNRKAWETPEEESKLLKLIPYGRVGEAKDIGPVAVWLASDDSDYITGTTIFVDGGMLLYPGFRTGG